MIRTFRYRLYPTKAQARALDFLLWQGRTLYNAALEQRIAVYRDTGEGVSYTQQSAHFRDLRHEQPETLGQFNATSVQQMLRRLDKTFAAFFRRLKASETPGFPRFKGRDRFHSLEYRHGDGCKLCTGERVTFYVQNVGEVKVKYHRPLPDDAAIKHVILKRRAHRWTVCLMLDLPDPALPAHSGPAVGIDMGLAHLPALSDGATVENPRWLRHSLAQLRVAQRRDFWHKTTRQLADTYSLITLEDLTLAFMTANYPLALSAHDAGLAEFQQLLAYKAEEAGTRAVTVTPAYTSQACSACGGVVQKDLSVRVPVCPDCGYTADRDVNAARNILRLAVNPARTGPPERNVAHWRERALGSSLI